MSKRYLLEFKEDVLSLHADGRKSQYIREYLKDRYNVDFNDRSIRRYIAKNNDAFNMFEEKLEQSNFKDIDNFEYGWLKTKEASIFIKNSKGVISFSQMREDFIKEMSNYSPSFPKINREKYKDEHLLVVDIADLHVGKLAEYSETGNEYNSNVAKKRAIEGVNGLLQKASGFPITKILFIIGNDVLHVDNANKTTTSGTPQDVDGMWYKNYLIARDVYIEVLNMLVQLADVHVVHNPSNHDFVSGFMLADSIYCWFRNNDNITFDITNRHIKYYTYGKNLISTSHGDGAKMSDMPLLMANDVPQEWAKTYWRYVYLHHIHHKDVTKFKSGKDYQGVTVEYVRSPSGTDRWHKNNGYCFAPKAIEAFVHSKEFGQVARLTHLFK